MNIITSGSADGSANGVKPGSEGGAVKKAAIPAASGSSKCSDDSPINTLRIARFDMVAEFTEETVLSSFIGNTFRGAFGEAIVRNFCKKSNPDCDDCRHCQDCAYFRVYKTAENLHGIKGTTPNPFVLKLPYTARKRTYAAGEALPFSILLFGSAVRFADDVHTAITDLYHGKLSTLRQRSCEKTNITWSDRGKTVPVDSLRIRFTTPTRITQTQEESAPDRFFLPFTNALFARISLILDLYGESDFVLPCKLIYRKPKVISRCDFHNEIIKQKEFSFDGITGTVVMNGDLTKYMPYIALGQMLHVGKMTTRGCGAYECSVE